MTVNVVSGYSVCVNEMCVYMRGTFLVTVSTQQTIFIHNIRKYCETFINDTVFMVPRRVIVQHHVLNHLIQ